MSTHDGSLTQTIALDAGLLGRSGVDVLHDLHGRWMHVLNGIARDPHIALWAHLERRRTNPASGPYDTAHDTHAAATGDGALTNSLYVSPVYRAADGRSRRRWARDPRHPGDGIFAQQPAVAELTELSARLQACLHTYRPGLVGARQTQGMYQSALLDFYAHLITHQPPRCAPYPAASGRDLSTSMLHFGVDTVGIDTPQGSVYTRALTAVSPYPSEPIRSDLFEDLLTAPFEFLLSQSVTAAIFDRSDVLYESHKDEHGNARASSTAQDVSGHAVPAIFEHELILLIYGTSLPELDMNVRRASAMLAARDIRLSCERGEALVCAFFGVLPGNFRFGRLRAMPVSARSFANFLPLHQDVDVLSRPNRQADALLALS